MELNTNRPKLDIIIPVKNRTTVFRCAFTLISQLKPIHTVELGTLWLCDGGSNDSKCLAQLSNIATLNGVKVLTYPHAGFNKGWLLNQGLAISTAQLVMISDVDIVWNTNALQAVVAAALDSEQNLCSVDKVEESEKAAIAIQRQRYAYHIIQEDQGVTVDVRNAVKSEDNRPGCGLVCGQRSLFESIGGYRDCFVGWGWEDQDLLIRAQLLGYRVVSAGRVVHLTHGENSRNALTMKCRPELSRDRNILRCLQGIEAGLLRGDLPMSDAADAANSDCSALLESITVRYPQNLCS